MKRIFCFIPAILLVLAGQSHLSGKDLLEDHGNCFVCSVLSCQSLSNEAPGQVPDAVYISGVISSRQDDVISASFPRVVPIRAPPLAV